ncbi:putative bifunctional diguanylate cyclase/phosphodiesterase [Thiobacillus denitrificans]|nr:EAL domain-containing protein [Thiobacillus denitrificans]
MAGASLVQDTGLARFFDNLHWTASTITAAVLACFAAGSPRSPESARGLRWIAAGLTAYAIGQLVWDAQALLGYADFPSPSDFFYLLLGPLVATGLMFEAFRVGDAAERKTLLLDSIGLAIGVTLLVLVLYLPAGGQIKLLSVAVMLAYPASLIAAASIGLVAEPTLRLRFSWSYWLFLLSLVGSATVWMIWNTWALRGETVANIRVDAVFSLTALGMGVATLYWQVGASPNLHWERWSQAIVRVLPLATVVLAGSAVVLLGDRTDVSATSRTAVTIASLTVIVLAMLRQGMLLREHAQLKIVTRNLEESERQKNLILHTLPDLVWLKDADGVYQMCNPAFERFTGRTEAEMRGKTDFDIVGPELARKFRNEDAQAMLADHPLTSMHALQAVDGRDVQIESVKTTLRDRDRRVLGILGIARDVTERQRASEQLALVNFALNHVKEAALLADENAQFHYVNDEACRSLGWTPEELLRLKVTDIDRDLTGRGQWRALWEQIKVLNSMTIEGHYKTRSGRTFPVEVSVNYFVYGGREYVLSLVRDVTERKEVEAQIRSLAYFDSLTGLPNRRLLLDRLNQARLSSERTREYGALMILDLDRFKTLNDTQGHDVGDRLLIDVARRLTASVRQNDTVCRLGGDEFVVVLEGFGSDEDQAVTQAEAIAEKVRAALNQPYSLSGNGSRFHSTTSVGLTLFCGHDATADMLLKQADVALYQAKDAGRNLVRFFNPAMQAAIDTRMAMEAALRQALERDEFHVYYQPQVDQRERVIGAEALLRWRPQGNEAISPLEFIPLAEETGLILPIGKWVLDVACAQLKAWESDPRAAHLKIAVNVSARQFHEPDFVATVQDSLARSGVDPTRLQLELTESVVLEKIETVVSRMEELNALGVSFCLDDFGTGYSSLSYLKRLPLDQVKIDQSFVRDVVDDSNDAAIVQAIMAMSRSLGLNVIAEGVETHAQRDFLAGKCLGYQGFLFCEPIPIEQWERVLK